MSETGEQQVFTSSSLEESHRRALGKLGAYLEATNQNPEQSILRKHQVPVLEDIHKSLAEYGADLKGYISAPTGVGKTVLFARLVRATNLRTLVLTPTRLLVDQTQESFARFVDPQDDELSIGRVVADKKEGDAHITVSTYASFVRHTKDEGSSHIDPSRYDLIILDEAHHALGTETKTVLQKYYSHIAQIGFTASENYSERKKLKDLLPHEIHKITIPEAVGLKLISPFVSWLVQTETDMSEVRVNSMNEYDQEDLQRTLNTKARNQIAAELYLRHFQGEKAIFACSGVGHAKSMVEVLQKEGVAAAAIHGGLSITEQKKLKARFATGELKALCNDKILAEGFDDQGVVAAFNLASTRSKIRCKQRNGRVVRLDEENPDKVAIIIEFIDRNYRKPPVLFASADIGGGAWVGAENRIDAAGVYDFNLASAEVITDPTLIEDIAADFEAQERKGVLPMAPEDWVTLQLLKDDLRAPVEKLQQALARLRHNEPEIAQKYSGHFGSRRGRNVLTTFCDPAIAEYLEPYIDRPVFAPKSWRSAGQVIALYGLQKPYVSSRLKQIASLQTAQNAVEPTDYTNKFVGDQHTHKKFYFHPDCVKILVEKSDKEYLGEGVPDSWSAEENVAKLLGGIQVLHVACERVQAMSQSWLADHSLMVSNERFYSPEVVVKLKEAVLPLNGWQTDEGIAETMQVPLATVQKVLADAQEKFPLAYNSYSAQCWVNSRPRMYFEPQFIQDLFVETKKQHQGAVAAPVVLEEDMPVLIARFERTRKQEAERSEKPKNDPFAGIIFEDIPGDE